MIDRLGRIITDLGPFTLSLAIGLASLVVPKRRGQIAFYPAFSPSSGSGDLAILYERMSADSEPRGRRLVWLTRSAAVANSLRERGRAVHLSTGRPFWALLRSDVIVLDSLDMRIAFGRFRMVQVWHGTGFKRIGLEKGNRTWLRTTALRAHCRKYLLIAASSRADAERKILCFDNSKARVTGQPRNDALVDGSARQPELLRVLSIAADQQVIAYCPTFRDAGRAVPLTPDEWHLLNQALERRNAKFLVKRHPRDLALHIPTGLSQIQDVTSQVTDVQQLLAIIDLLVSDYSSISTDFALTNKPIIFYNYDEAGYRKHARGFYIDLEKVLPGPFARTPEALLKLIAEQDWFTTQEYQERYKYFRTHFHEYRDNQSAARLQAAVEDVLAQS